MSQKYSPGDIVFIPRSCPISDRAGTPIDNYKGCIGVIDSIADLDNWYRVRLFRDSLPIAILLLAAHELEPMYQI